MPLHPAPSSSTPPSITHNLASVQRRTFSNLPVHHTASPFPLGLSAKPTASGPHRDPSSGIAHGLAGHPHRVSTFLSPYGRAYVHTHGSNHVFGLGSGIRCANQSRSTLQLRQRSSLDRHRRCIRTPRRQRVGPYKPNCESQLLHAKPMRASRVHLKSKKLAFDTTSRRPQDYRA
jgi:hypothetical protein